MALGNSSKDTTQLSRKTGTRKTTAPAPSTRAAAPRSYCAALPYVGFLVACCLATFLAGARWKGAALASLDSLDPVVRRDARLDAAQNPSIVLGGSATAALSSFRGGGGGAGGVDGGAATFSRGAAPGGPVTAPPSHVNTIRVNNSRPSTMAVRPMSEEAMNFCDNVNTARQSTMRQLGAAAQAAQAVLATVCSGERGGGGGGGGGGGSVRSPAATTVTLPPWSSAAPGGFEGAVAKDADEDVSAATATFSSARGRDPPLALPPLPPLPVPGEPERKGRAHGAPPEFGHASHHRAAPERAEATQTVPAGAGGVAGGKRAGEGAAAAANATRSSAAVFERNVSPAPNASVPGVTSGEEGGVGPSRADSQRGVASWLSGAKEGGVRVERQLRAEARRLSGECASCTGSFFLKQGACSPWTVNCDVLGKVEANAATNSADAVCGADKTCLCATGSATTGTSCPTNGATSCRDADTGGGGSGFNWGGACSDGSGEFKQAIVKDSTVTVGTIPKDKADVEIVLTSTKDVDIQLVDEGKTPAKEIVAWPNGIVNGAGEESVSYESVAVKYSGYNGVNGKQGNEYIHLGKGSQTNRPLVMRAFGYAAGEATVKYSWKAPTDCVDAGCGDFEQLIQSKAVVDVGKIPAGKQSVKIYLYSAVDVDVQLHDTASGKEIIAWPNGLLNGGTQGCVTHEGLEYCYSGYNGAGGKLGNEYILVKGITNREVTMKAFGYASGSAIIEYGWGDATDCGRACCSKPATSAMQVGVVETKRTPLRTISNTPAASTAILAPVTGNGVAGKSSTTNENEGSSIVVVALTGVGGLVVGAAAMALGSVFMRRRGASRAEAPAVEMQGNPMGDNTATV